MKDDRWMMIHDNDKRDDMVKREDMQERWKMKDDKRHEIRHDIFPEDDILDIITISRYNYHKYIICKMCEPCETLSTE